MSKKEKLVKRFIQKPKDFTYNELTALLRYFGYTEVSMGKSSGSRRSFVHNKSKHIIRLHKPHPKNILKSYQINLILEELKKEGLL